MKERTRGWRYCVAMGKGTSGGVPGMGSWCEMAPPQIITVDKTRHKTMETILERVAAMGAWLENAPPQIIEPQRSSPRKNSLDTIAEESMSMFVDIGAASSNSASLRPMRRNWETSSSSSSSSIAIPQRIPTGFVACN